MATQRIPALAALGVLAVLVAVGCALSASESTDRGAPAASATIVPAVDDRLPQCAMLEQSEPACAGGTARGIKELPDVIGSCPTDPVSQATDAGPSRAADAAVRYLTTVGEWRSAQVDLTYRVGTSDAGFGSLFATQIPKWCGQAVADASYGVELTDTSGKWQGTDAHVGVVVAQFATGWRVWGAFH